MNLRSTNREGMAPIMARQFTESYPGFPQSTAEILAYESHFLEGAHEEHWHAEDGSVALSLFASDETMPPKRMEAEVHTTRDEDYEPAVIFAEEHTRALGTHDLSIWTRGDRTLRRNVLESRGYALIQTAPSSMLDIEQFDASRFADKLAACPYRIASIAELIAEGVDWVPLLYTATLEMARDVPDPHDFVPMPLDQYTEMIKNPVTYNYQLMFAAMDGDQIIGYTRVTPMQVDATLVGTGLSGVRRAYRRQGIVTALKVRAIMALQERRYKRLLTENDVSNPMYQLNLDLGFTWVWDWLQFGRKNI